MPRHSRYLERYMSGWVARGTAGDQASPEKTKIILVDDEPTMIESKKAVVNSGIVDAWQGWEILYASSAEEALELFKAHPDVTHIVTDRSVASNGVQVLGKIAEHIEDNPQEQRAFKGAVVYSWYMGDDPKETPLAIKGMKIVRVPNEPIGSTTFADLTVVDSRYVAPPPSNPSDFFANLPVPVAEPWFAKIAGAVSRVNEMAAGKTPA